MKRERSASLKRVLGIMRRLQDGRASLGELATEFAVHERTIRRDLYVLSEVGIPISNNASRGYPGGVWFILR